MTGLTLVCGVGRHEPFKSIVGHVRELPDDIPH